MFSVNKKYVFNQEDKKGCDLCNTNIYLHETYYDILDFESEIILTVCEFCKPKLIDRLSK